MSKQKTIEDEMYELLDILVKMVEERYTLQKETGYRLHVLRYLFLHKGEWISISETQKWIGHDLSGNDWSYVYVAYNTIRKHLLKLHELQVVAMKREFINLQHRIYFKLGGDMGN